MEIKDGTVISVRHYSGLSPFKSVVLEATENTITIKLAKEFAVMNFLDGDPVVFGTVSGNEVHIVGCNIIKVNPKEGILQLAIDKVESDAEKRQYERFPVSLYADVRIRDSRKKYLAIIKDISYYGMLVYSKESLEINEQMDIDIYLDKTMIFLKGSVARKDKNPNYFEYGLKITYEDANSLNYVRDYLKRLKESQEDSVRKMKGF